VIDEAEVYCANTSAFTESFHIIMQCLYKLDLVSESVILEWGTSAQSTIDSFKERLTDVTNVTRSHSALLKNTEDLSLGVSKNATEIDGDVNSQDDEEFLDEQDDVLQSVGIQMREKFFLAMGPFLQWLKEHDEKSSSSSSSSSSSDSKSEKGSKKSSSAESKRSSSSSSSASSGK